MTAAVGADVTALGDLIQGVLDVTPGLTVAEIARRSHLTPQLVYGWLDHSRPLKEFPKPQTLARLARGLRIPETAVIEACLRDLGLATAVADSDPRRAVLLAAASQVPEDQLRRVTAIVQAFLEENRDTDDTPR